MAPGEIDLQGEKRDSLLTRSEVRLFEFSAKWFAFARTIFVFGEASIFLTRIGAMILVAAEVRRRMESQTLNIRLVTSAATNRRFVEIWISSVL